MCMKESVIKFSMIRATCPTLPILTLYHLPNNIWQEVQIINVNTNKFPQNSNHLVPLSFQPSSSALRSPANYIHVYLVNLFKLSTTISWKISRPSLVAQLTYMGQVRPGQSAQSFQQTYFINCLAWVCWRAISINTIMIDANRPRRPDTFSSKRTTN